MLALARIGPLGIACVLGLALAVAALAAPGDLDPAFGVGGRVVVSPAVESLASAVAVQADGKLVLAGTVDDQAPPPPPPPAPDVPWISNQDFLAVRLARDGGVDPTFGSGGVARTSISPAGPASDGARAAAVGPDGKIVLAGFTVAPGGTDFAFVRYTASGALDPTFSGDGIQTVDVGQIDGATGVVVQPDGKVVAVGSGGSGFTVLRLRTSGQLDPSFGTRGVVNSPIGDPGLRDDASAVILRGGKIVVGGTADMPSPRRNNFALVRYLPNGRRDPSFGSGGIVVAKRRSEGRAWALAGAPQGRLVLAGDNGSGSFRVARFLATGAPDRAFGAAGVALTSFPHAYSMARGVVVQDDGKIVAGGLALGPHPGGSDAFAVVRYNQDGTPDASFGAAGRKTYDALAELIWGGGVVIQPGTVTGSAGRLIVPGQGSDGTADHALALGVDLGPLGPAPPPVRCRVPRLVGLRLGAARSKIRRAHCSVGRIRRVRAARFVGRVVRQSPRSGRRLPRGTRVNLVVGR